MSDLLLSPEHRYAKEIEKRRNEDGSELSILNLGPTHPATHGIFQNILLMDGERILDGEGTVGYIHRAFEKIAENRPFYQITVLTDRMNYCSAPINNMGWWMTLEKALGIEVPKRVQYLRVIIMELARIADHIICSSVMGVDTGALTGFLYVFQFRFGAAYFLWYYERSMLGPVGKHVSAAVKDLHMREITIALSLSIMILWIGLYPSPFLRMMNGSIQALVDRLDRAKMASVNTVTHVPSK